MTDLHTTIKRVSNYVATRSDRFLKNGAVSRVLVKNTPDVTVDCLGIPVIADGAGAWKFFENLDDIATTVAINGAKVGVIVGEKSGYGHNLDPVTFTAAGAEVHVLFGLFGTPIVKSANFDWSVVDTDGNPAVTPADAGEMAEFILQLRLQGVADQSVATVIDPTLVL